MDQMRRTTVRRNANELRTGDGPRGEKPTEGPLIGRAVTDRKSA